LSNGGTLKRINCVAYSDDNSGAGYTIGYGSAATPPTTLLDLTNYNCTAYGCKIGFVDAQATINCIAANAATACFSSVGTGGGNSDYNASNDGTAVGAHSKTSQDFTSTFVDASAGNFNLQSGDTVAKGAGVTQPTDLSDSNIVGATRTVPWNIGAW
jgi:hypothetical protein